MYSLAWSFGDMIWNAFGTHNIVIEFPIRGRSCQNNTSVTAKTFGAFWNAKDLKYI